MAGASCWGAIAGSSAARYASNARRVGEEVGCEFGDAYCFGGLSPGDAGTGYDGGGGSAGADFVLLSKCGRGKPGADREDEEVFGETRNRASVCKPGCGDVLEFAEKRADAGGKFEQRNYGDRVDRTADGEYRDAAAGARAGQ